MKNNYQHLIKLLDNNKDIVFGLLLHKKGSAPQVPGASAIFDQKGLVTGTLGGGILELEAEKLAQSLWSSKQNQTKQIDYTSDIAEDGGAICGGIASFLLDFHPAKSMSVFKEMDQAIKQQRSGYLITKIEANTTDISRYWSLNIENCESIPPALKALITKKHHKQQSELFSFEDATWFIEHICPPPQLVIIGAGHIGQALCHQGALLGFQLTVVDNRQNYATHSLVPEAQQVIVKDQLTAAISDLNITTDTYVVIATQGHKTDCEALSEVIHSDACYIGMIGSRRKIKQVKTDFITKGIASEDQLNGLHAPIGIDIGSKTVQEIAISIAAELVLVRNAKSS